MHPLLSSDPRGRFRRSIRREVGIDGSMGPDPKITTDRTPMPGGFEHVDLAAVPHSKMVGLEEEL
jgi:hypothetical protein